MAKAYKPRIQKQINHLSRAINKIDPKLGQTTLALEYAIKDLQMGFNDIQYTRNGVDVKIKYTDIPSLSQREQASLLKKLSAERYRLRQQRALEQLQEKGKISWQFKRSIQEQNKKLAENIEEIENLIGENKAEVIKEEFEKISVQTGEEWFKEADSFFQLTDSEGRRNTPELFDFYRPGESGGFSELNAFTWNAYKVLRGI